MSGYSGPYHSFHAVINELSSLLKERIISLTDYTNSLLGKKQGEYLLLSTKGSYQFQVLEKREGLLYPLVEDQEKIHNYIYRIKKGEPRELVFLEIEKLIQRYSCKGLILGCTDFYMISNHIESHFNYLDVINPLKVIK